MQQGWNSNLFLLRNRHKPVEKSYKVLIKKRFEENGRKVEES